MTALTTNSLEPPTPQTCQVTEATPKLTCILHQNLGHVLAVHEEWERVSSVVPLMDLSNLHCIVHEVVVNDVVPAFPEQAIRVIPDGIESKNL